MSESDPINVLAGMSDHDILVEVYASQLRTEIMVREFIDMVQPTVEKFAKGGMLGMLGALR